MDWRNMAISMMKMKKHISTASLLSEKLDGYIWKRGPDVSADRVLRELNNIDEQLHEARSLNARLRKEINHAKYKAGTKS